MGCEETTIFLMEREDKIHKNNAISWSCALIISYVEKRKQGQISLKRW